VIFHHLSTIKETGKFIKPYEQKKIAIKYKKIFFSESKTLAFFLE
jgi:hypothetical protein